MQLTKSFIQPESEIVITVRYNPLIDEVTRVINVQCYNKHSGEWVNVSNIFAEHFNLDEIVEGIDWREVAAESEVIELENEGV